MKSCLFCSGPMGPILGPTCACCLREMEEDTAREASALAAGPEGWVIQTRIGASLRWILAEDLSTVHATREAAVDRVSLIREGGGLDLWQFRVRRTR